MEGREVVGVEEEGLVVLEVSTMRVDLGRSLEERVPATVRRRFVIERIGFGVSFGDCGLINRER